MTRAEIAALIGELRACPVDRTHAATDPPVLVPSSLVTRIVRALRSLKGGK